jgi:hypothetical protein
MYGRGRVVDHQHTIATVWSLSLDQLRERQPAAVQLLRLCAYLAPEPIPLDVFTSQPSRLPAPLDRAAGDPLALADAVGALVDYSLVDRTESGLLLHRLVQAVVRQSGFDQPDSPGPLPVVFGLLDVVDQLDHECPADWPRFRMLGSHLQVLFDTVVHRMDRAGLHHLVASTTAVARAYNSCGTLRAAEFLLRKILSVSGLLEEHDLDILVARHNLAWTIGVLGQLTESEAMFCTVLSIRRQVLGEEHMDTLRTRHELAWVTASQGRWTEAEAMYRSVLDARQRVLGEEHHHTLTTRLELAWTKAAQGERTTAIREYEEVLDARQRVLGEEHRETIENQTLLQSLREGRIVRPRHLA